MFALLGVYIVVGGLQLGLGVPQRIGPGYFPLIVGGLMTCLGILLALQAALRAEPDEEPMAFHHIRPLVAIIGPVFVFGLVIDFLGLFISVLVLVALSRLAEKELNLKSIVLTSVALAAIAAGIFVYGLGVPLKLWPL
jgi:Co/Zn/Cd efflux system component